MAISGQSGHSESSTGRTHRGVMWGAGEGKRSGAQMGVQQMSWAHGVWDAESQVKGSSCGHRCNV